MGERRDKVLRFVVTGALLGAPVATGCGGNEVEANEPYEVHTVNEPVQEEEEDITANEPYDGPEAESPEETEDDGARVDDPPEDD